MPKDILTDSQVEQEIARLLASDDVKLAKQVERVRNRRRQYMYSLRTMEKHGKQLAKEGWTLDNIQEMFENDYC